MSYSSKLQALRGQRNQVAGDLRRLVDEHPGEAWTSDCVAKYDGGLAQIDSIDAEITRIERVVSIEAAASGALDRRAGTQGISDQRAQDQASEEMQAFMAYLRVGMAEMPENLRAVARQRFASPQGAGVGTGAAGGFTVPQEFLAVLESAMRAFGGVLEVATVINTDGGADMPMPTNNDTAAVATILAENTAMAVADVTFGQVMLRSNMYASGLVPVSYQLMQDTAFDLGTWLATRLGERLARGQNAHFTNGTGTGQPQGIFTAAGGATIGHTMPAGNTLSYTYGGLVALQHSVDPAYRRMPGCVWMMSDTALRQIRLIVDAQSRPIFVPGYTLPQQAVGGQPDTIMGHRVVINQDVPVPAANARSVAFGDFSRYYIRRVGAPMVQRLNERFADALQVAFIGFHRADGRIVDAGTNPFRILQNSAT